jgi:uncharacterized Zn finger protein
MMRQAVPFPGIAENALLCGDCGATEARETLRERISEKQTVVRYHCARCAAVHMRLIPHTLTAAAITSPAPAMPMPR